MNLYRRTISLFLCFVLIICTFVAFNPCDFSYASEKVADIEVSSRSNSYQTYIDNVSEKEQPTNEFFRTGADCNQIQNCTVINYQDKQNVLEISGNGIASWNFDILSAGLYEIKLEYCSFPETSTDMNVSITLNGSLPFNESQNIVLPCLWKDEGDIIQDYNGNDMRPRQKRAYVWDSFALKGNDGVFNGNYMFEMKKGLNNIQISSNGQPVAISGIWVYNNPIIGDYSKVKNEYYVKGYTYAKDVYKIQAEKNAFKSASLLGSTYDRSSASTEPQDAAEIRINIAGGQNWKMPGQWISWSLDIPSDGLYKIAIKYRQSYLQGVSSCRKLTIDGKVPFEELESVGFPYTDDWDTLIPGNGKEPYLLYLSKGNHELRMENVTGDISDTVRDCEGAIFALNDIYRKIIMIASSKPDPYKDYYFDKQIPELHETFTQTALLLENDSQRIKSINNGKGGNQTSAIENTVRQLESMVTDVSTISERLESFKNNISALSAWVLSVKEQPLDIDYIEFLPPDNLCQEPKSGFVKSVLFEINKFFATFSDNYSLTEKKYSEKKKIKVWVNLGRDQAGIIKDMISDMFTKETGIDVELELVQGALIESTLANRGPDVALMQSGSQPVNFAIRGALVDLTQFSDYSEVAKQFYPSAIIPFTFRNGVYALPDSQTYYTMFCRTDILKQLDLKIPQTWTEFYQIVPILQRYNMDAGLPNVTAVVGAGEAAPPSQTLFSAFLFQNGGRYYKEDLRSTAFDEETVKDAFAELTRCYTRYGFPITYDFYNRFRTGEMPIGIQPYTTYNQLYAAAPEIKGLWDMSPIPGTVKPDGTIDRSQGTQGSGCIMFQKAKDKEAAWEFIKWFVGTEAQARFGLELESIMGPSARYPTANIEAIKKLPWNQKELNVLEEQWKYVRGIPEMPGSYYTAFGLQNAFRSAIIDYANPYEALHIWNVEINNEIKRKYEEFGIN